MSDVQMTHSTDCWQWHHECAKRVVEELRVENERLSQDAERWRYYERHYGGADLQEKVDAAMSAEQRR